MNRDQQAARVNVDADDWLEFRTLAMRKRRTIADYLGELVRAELVATAPPSTGGDRSGAGQPQPQPVAPVRLADQQLLTSLPHRRRWGAPPPGQ